MTARRTNMPLDRMTIETHVTPWASLDAAGGEALQYPGDGAYIHGLYMEGAYVRRTRAPSHLPSACAP